MVLSGPGFVVFSQVPARADSLVAEVREALESYGLAPAPVSVHLRAAYSHAIPGGQSARCSDNLALAMHPSGSAQKFRNSWVSARETRKSVSSYGICNSPLLSFLSMTEALGSGKPGISRTTWKVTQLDQLLTQAGRFINQGSTLPRSIYFVAEQ
jgi:hypothetical protein